jgi:1,6-anhydro-N-acetylmuramate kinase
LQVRRTIPPTLGISPKLDARRRDEHHGGTGPLAHAAEHVDLVRCARARSWP